MSDWIWIIRKSQLLNSMLCVNCELLHGNSNEFRLNLGLNFHITSFGCAHKLQRLFKLFTAIGVHTFDKV